MPLVTNAAEFDVNVFDDATVIPSLPPIVLSVADANITSVADVLNISVPRVGAGLPPNFQLFETSVPLINRCISSMLSAELYLHDKATWCSSAASQSCISAEIA